MARIPIPLYQQQQQTPLGMPVARAPMVAVQDNSGQALGQAGRALGQVADTQLKVQQEDARVWASTAASNDQVKWMQRMQELQNTAQPGAPDFTPTVLGEYDDFMGKALENAPDLAKPFYREQLQRQRTYLADRAIRWQDQQRHANNIHQYEQGAQADAIAVSMDPSLYDERLVSRQAALSTAMLPPDTKAKLWDNAQTLLSVAAESTAMQADPQAWLAQRRPGVTGAIRTFADVSGIDPAYMLAVADIETGGTFDPAAKNPKSTAGGLFQFTDGTWAQYAPGQDRNNPQANARAAAAFTADNQKALTRTLGRQPSGWELYLAHQQGAGGAAALLTADPSSTVSQALTDAGIANAERAASDNGMAGMSVGEALSMWEGKFSRAYQKHRGATSPQEPGRVGVPAFDNLDWSAQQKLQQQAVTLSKQRQAEYKALIQDQIGDQEATWLSGKDYDGPTLTKDQFVSAYGVAEGLERWGKHRDIYQTGQDIQALSGMSEGEIIQTLQAKQPVGGAGFEDQAKRFDILRKAAAGVIKERESDPASYVLNTNPAIRQSYEAMASASPDTIGAATRAYASQAIAEQQRLGITTPRLLSNNQTQSVVQTFYNQAEGAQNAADIIKGLEGQWGEHWPTVYKQLAESGKLPAVALVIPNIPDEGARVRAASRALVDEKVYKDRLDSTAPRDIEESLTKEMGDLWASFSYQNGGANTYQTIYKEARKAALEYAANGKSISDAVEQAYQEVIGDKYEFADGYRIPIWPVNEDPDRVSLGAQKVIQAIDGRGLKIPPSLAGLPDNAARKAWVDAIKANGQLVTNDDETGLNLYVMGNNGLNAVRDTQGRQISFTWAQLRDEGAATSTALGAATKVLTGVISGQYR